MSKITIQDFLKKKAGHKKITMLTAYDYPFAKIVDEAGIDAIIVGDSVGMVVQGLENTLPVTMDEMIYHTNIVSRAVKNAMVIGDLPFMSYQASIEDAIRNAGRFLKDAGASAVKIEGGAEVAAHIRAMTKSDIPIMAHIGLTPQSIHRMGGYKIQGKTEESAKKLLEEAHIAEDAGAFSLLLEAIPIGLAKKITEELSIPTIGIGAGPYCDGQVLVLHDVIGLFERFLPKFAKRYVNLKDEALNAIKVYKEEVEKGIFPSEEQSFK
ncbi:MAG: 3-methyl-2-oxobutanoate hydroxymethyltransferase [Nitrospirae bacterium CG_4_10_14_0_8_um_filter_41_23]|nr:3-methyl-2-oxobutanoate hydroxymethyltransferase [Nitrospirota bacterium]OIP59229.1 MAG: 3-methyl-2-oxobutanoate hydroxymethyltransferase [Nitrospirae bacterium CG2_30_41_42]PIQ95281.1 MAG: 3-methyl-2-oxobutanoate hydroxymethyltransferase [Nitrospirae bacterium CG11_big_fil_rev_8_21_14_0_20_41_14]PIV44139.1 MAG: 3-methyl-2-oxobutanoate hydroxymethyltransferase [Nitrospirae bacterium CG02_land_8_20_14_3_00_41_53]PIW87266.1 MAG: 3-methyl-2-oxobutanoate hydroxymethyltransferase [Nitrospirae bac